MFGQLAIANPLQTWAFHLGRSGRELPHERYQQAPKMPKFRCVPALFNRRGIDFSRSQRDQALAPPTNTTNLLLVGPTDPAACVEGGMYHDTWTDARIFVGLLSPVVRRWLAEHTGQGTGAWSVASKEPP